MSGITFLTEEEMAAININQCPDPNCQGEVSFGPEINMMVEVICKKCGKKSSLSTDPYARKFPTA